VRNTEIEKMILQRKQGEDLMFAGNVCSMVDRSGRNRRRRRNNILKKPLPLEGTGGGVKKSAVSGCDKIKTHIH
jgi:hypothetical protein